MLVSSVFPQGEVHVPQSELGSLLRTAEGLQVKGLAVPDDSPRVSSSSLPSAAAVVPSVPSVPRSHPPTLIAPSHLRGKRKRPAGRVPNVPAVSWSCEQEQIPVMICEAFVLNIFLCIFLFLKEYCMLLFLA